MHYHMENGMKIRKDRFGALLNNLPLVVLSVMVPASFFARTMYAQTQRTIAASKDNTLYESSTGALSNGAGQTFFVGRTNQISGSIRRGLLAFDIAGPLPAGAMIDSVRLRLNMSLTTAGAQTVQLHRVLSDWGEGTSNANTGGGGGGAPSTAGDATWVHRFFNSSPWTTVGGDFSSTVSASQSVAGIGFYPWGSTPQMVNDVQMWLDTPLSNFGWLLRGVESLAPTAKRFDTRENINPGVRPALTVFYRTSVGMKDDPQLPSKIILYQNYPNPFNPTTSITFSLPSAQHVTLSVLDVLGQEISTLLREQRTAGTHSVTFDGTGLASGVYYYKLQAGLFVQVKKAILTR